MLAAASTALAFAQGEPPPRREVFRVASENMAPTLLPRERVEVDMSVYERSRPRVGDIVVLRPPQGAITGASGSRREPSEGELCARPTRASAARVRFWGAARRSEVLGRMTRSLGPRGD